VDASALTVTMTAKVESNEKPVVIGTTNLPDGVSLMITLTRSASKFMAQDKATVKDGAFRAGPFSQKGSGLNPGTYTLEVIMPLADLQPPYTWPIIGNQGASLRGPLSKKSEFGGRIVEYRTKFEVGGGQPSAKKDKEARMQANKDAHAWWLQSCQDICKRTQELARSRNEAFNWDRCYYSCVADESKKK